jgi:hypothetical protein
MPAKLERFWTMQSNQVGDTHLHQKERIAINSNEEFYNFLCQIVMHADNSPISNITNATVFLNTMVQDIVGTLMNGAWMYRVASTHRDSRSTRMRFTP